MNGSKSQPKTMFHPFKSAPSAGSKREAKLGTQKLSAILNESANTAATCGSIDCIDFCKQKAERLATHYEKKKSAETLLTTTLLTKLLIFFYI